MITVKFYRFASIKDFSAQIKEEHYTELKESYDSKT